MTEYRKNDLLIVKIEDMGDAGEGIGKTVDGFTLFIKDTIIGDLVEVKIMKVKRNYAFAKLKRILCPSEHRVEPACPVYSRCGGCQFQTLDYQEQLRYKQDKIRNDLIRIGGFEEPPLEPIAGMENPYHYRNKAQVPIGTDRDGNPVAGFYAGRTHTIIPFTRCCLGAEVNADILEIILAFMKARHIRAYEELTGKGLVRHVLIRSGFTTKEIMVCLVLNGKKLPFAEELADSLWKIKGMTSITLNVNTSRGNVILGREIIPVRGEPFITDYIGDIKFRISPLSFYQVNPVQTRVLYQKVLEYAGLTGKETVWDLYCGIGTISLFLAQKAKMVYGIEIVPEAVEDARINAEKNGIANAVFYAGKAEEMAPSLFEAEGLRADVVVVDPPRKGCDEALLNTIAAMRPEKVVYVSCDPATLARDLKYLGGRGYEMARGGGVDCFGMTKHVESIVLLQRRA